MPHTPGPWVADTTHPEQAPFVVWAKDLMIADVIQDQHENAEANARLIAAAPELLECCYRLLQIVEVEYEADPEPEDLDTWREAIQLAAACIAKAEGRGE